MKRMDVLARRVRDNLPAALWKRVTDPRKDRGKRHPLGGMLGLLVLGFLTHARALRDVEQLGKDLPNRRVLGLRGAPSDTTLDRIVRCVSPLEIQGVLELLVQQMVRSKQLPVDPAIGVSLVALDGKRFGTSDTPEHPEARRCPTHGAAEPRWQVHSLRGVHVASAVKPVLGQRVVPSDGGEAPELWPFVEHLRATYGSLVEAVSFDAGLTSYLNLYRLNEGGVGFIAAIKHNVGLLRTWAGEQLGEGEERPSCGWERVTEEGPPSRRVRRHFARVPGDNLESIGWQGQLTEVWRLHTVTERGGKREVGNRYFVTNLPSGRLTRDQAMAAIRAHWGIENDANGTLDLQLHEDNQTWVNQGQAAEILALLRLIAYNFLRLLRQRVLRAKGTPLLAWRTLMRQIYTALTTPGWVWEPSGID